jgi:hypothetical protein
LKKKIAAPKKISLHRETLRHLDAEPLAAVHGGVVTVGRACEPTSHCGTTSGCTVTACGHC